MSKNHPKRPRPYTAQKQKKLIPDDEVHQAFLRREDISVLSKQEQEKRWAKHLVNLNKFRNSLANLPAFVIK